MASERSSTTKMKTFLEKDSINVGAVNRKGIEATYDSPSTCNVFRT